MQKREAGGRKEGRAAPRCAGCLLPHPTLTCQDVNPFTSSSFPDTCIQLLLLKIFCKEIKPVNPKGNQPCIFIGRTDVEAEAPILWPPDSNSWLMGKDPDAGKDWRQKEKRVTEETVGWHHWLNGHEFEQTPGVGDGQGGLACCSAWGGRVGRDRATEQQQRCLLTCLIKVLC